MEAHKKWTKLSCPLRYMRHVRYATFGAMAYKCTVKLFPNINLCLEHDLMDRLVPKSGTFYFKIHRNLNHYKQVKKLRPFRVMSVTLTVTAFSLEPFNKIW